MAQIRRYDEIMEAALSNMIARQDKLTDFNEGSVIHTFLDTVARLAERAYVAIRQGYNEQMAILPYSPFGMEKKDGLRAGGTVVFGREAPLNAATVIPKGTRVSGGGKSFTTTESGTIAAGALESDAINATADEAGASSNVAAGTIESIDSVVSPDVVRVSNAAAFSGGTDEETDAEFEARFRAYINGLSGTNLYAIKSAALGVNQVRSVSVQNHKPPLRNIYNLSVYVDDGSGGASEEAIQAVKEAIEGDGTAESPGHLAPGVNARVLAPTSVPVDVSASVKILSYDTDEAREEVGRVIAEYVNGKTIGEEVVVSELCVAVMSLNYVSDCTIRAPVQNVSPGIDQIARIGNLTLEIEEAD